MVNILIGLLAVLLIARYAFGLSFLMMLAHHTSWNVAILEVLATALLGLLIFAYLKVQFERRAVARLATGEPLGAVLMDGLLVLLAGILLILPSIITDVAGLLLIIPPIRRLIVGFFERRNLARVRNLRARADRALRTEPPPS
jgi:UPF0716 protein FxsA